jgi:hypothetical protein
MRATTISLATAAMLAGSLCCLASRSAAAIRDDDLPPAKVVYGELLLSIFPNELLPPGYVVTVVQGYPLSKPSRRHHSLGAVVVNLNHSQAGIIYTVFRNKTDLQARWRDGFSDRGHRIFVDSKVKSSREIEGTTALDGKRVGATDIVFLEGDVLVSVITTSQRYRSHGDRLGALRLARAGLTQLRLLER